MPNKHQLAFLASFLSVFFSLVFISRYLGARLREAGYDINNLILLGLPKDNSTPTTPPLSVVSKMAAEQASAFFHDIVSANFHAVRVPYAGTYDFVAVASSPTFLITGAVILATAFLAKVLHTGALVPSPLFHLISHTQQAAQSLLTPTSGKNSLSRKRSGCRPIPPCTCPLSPNFYLQIFSTCHDS